MSLFDRLTRLAKSGVDEFVRALEGDDVEGVQEAPASALEQALEQARTSATECERAYRKLETEQAQYGSEMQKFEDLAAIQLSEGDEGAARASLEKKVDLERKIARLQPMVDEGRNTAEGLKTELYAIQLRLDESNRKMSELETRKRTVDAREALEKLREQLGKESAQEADEEDVLVREVKVDLEKRLRELEQPGAEFDRVELQERLDAEIATLRKKVVSDDKGTSD